MLRSEHNSFRDSFACVYPSPWLQLGVQAVALHVGRVLFNPMNPTDLLVLAQQWRDKAARIEVKYGSSDPARAARAALEGCAAELEELSKQCTSSCESVPSS